MALLLAGCNGFISDPGKPPTTDPGGGPGGAGGPGDPGVVNPPPMPLCNKPFAPGRAPLRRLTTFEYDNTVKDLLGDTTNPSSVLPAEDFGNGFGNDADKLSVSTLLAEKYDTAAEGIATRATATPAALAKLAPCGSTVTTATEPACARSIVETFGPKAYRRPLETGEADTLVALYTTLRAKTGATFATSVAGVLEAMLQAPDFLYRLEWGVPDPADATRRRPSGNEMASRLSYMFWASMPDDGLRTAAGNGSLLTADGVKTQATRLLADARSHAVVGFFFDSLLPLTQLTDLARDKVQFPTFSPAIGALMRQETQRFLEYTIFEGAGDWNTALTADYTFVNDALAAYYGIGGVTGAAFQKVPIDTSKRLGFLTQGGVMTGTTTTNFSNPVLRGSFFVNRMMCMKIELPSDPAILAQVKPPEPYSAPTARERYSAHSANVVCHACHQYMDPIGLALENYNPVGLWRDQENGYTIDASGSVPGTQGTVNGPIELIRKVATTDATKNCFATHWVEFGYGRTMDAMNMDDICTQESVQAAFKTSGYNVRQMLLALTQTDTFLYLPAP